VGFFTFGRAYSSCSSEGMKIQPEKLTHGVLFIIA
jgi:hypothetical protein